MVISSETGISSAAGIDEQFIELICADDELVQAEFDAIISAEWPATPPIRTTHREADCFHDADGELHAADGQPQSGPGEPVRASNEWAFARSPPTDAKLPDQDGSGCATPR